MKAVSGKKFCNLVEARGWELKRISGSHHIFAKAGENARISVPVHGKKPLAEIKESELLSLHITTKLSRGQTA